jgi:3alpha(or 20beta)-hydroxysteroid dehydrogenase
VGQLDGKVVVVTGAAQGMGRRHVERCVADGARVVATDVQEDAGRAVVAPLGEAAAFVTHDVTDEAGWDRVIATAAERFGRLDGVVNNAAVYGGIKPLEDTSVEEFERHLRVNVVGVFWGVKKAVAPLRAAGGGSIVNISSMAGMVGMSGYTSYGTSKWAVRGMTKILAAELGQYGIRVNSVHPGGIAETGMFPVPQSVEEREVRRNRVPLKRAGTVDDVSSLVVLLLSDHSTYITGVEHVIDGGLSLGI